MVWKRKKEDEFDAVHAAEELDQATGQQDAPSTEEYIRTLEVELEGMGSILSQKETLLQRAEARAAEQEDEIERIKRRLQTEADQKVEKRVAEVIDELLDVGDDLGRAILSAQEMNHEASVIQGLEMVRQSFGKRLQKIGVTRMQALGTKFDPNLHEAVSMMPVHDPSQDGVVLAVLREGYALNGKLLREARVAVGKLSS
ncbi:MAG: nucleotide exchange factor GrpE [Myxococcales bacterium]|nr:nucleotide exchange factor GrpE [Myxococcales bacterium]